MPLLRPTLTELIDRAKGDIKTELGLVTVIRRTFAYAIAKAVAGLSHMLHGHLVYVSRQIFPDQADGVYVERWATIFGLQKKLATFATLEIEITGDDDAVVPETTIYQRADGLTYTVDADITIVSGTGTGTITAAESGAASNLEPNDTVTLQSPLAGIDAEATVTGTAVEGEDEETDESLRARLVARMQAPPSGGTAADYLAWALEVAGVTRSWVLPAYLGSGTVGVSFSEGDGVVEIPAAPKVAEVQAYVDTKAPVTAQVTVFAPVEQVVNMTIAISPNTVAVQNAVQAELSAMFFRESQVRGAYKQVGQTFSGTIPLSKINEAISLAAGEEDHNVISPASDVTLPFDGRIATLGTITWQTL